MLASSALLALVSCVDLRDLRERAGDAAVAHRGDASFGSGTDATAAPVCEGPERSALRFWKLHLGQNDYVTVKNTGACSIELAGLRIFADDLDELLAERGDCEAELPAFLLAPGAEVRVAEDPLSGDIGFLENKISACPGDFSYNPARGGVTYLCDGECEADTVIDVVAHLGEMYIAPPMRFEQNFDSPLKGVTVAAQESTRFRRVATLGAAPNFLNADWQRETRYVHAGFENAVDVAIDDVSRAWLPEEGQSATVSTSESAAVGGIALSVAHDASDGRSSGLGIELPKNGGMPSHISYFARIEQLPAEGAYLDVQGKDGSLMRAGFEASGVGVELEGGTRAATPATQATWYQVELRDLDWSARTYDVYVDRVLVAPRTRFSTSATRADTLSLYSVSGGSTALWDEIEFWRLDPM